MGSDTEAKSVSIKGREGAKSRTAKQSALARLNSETKYSLLRSTIAADWRSSVIAKFCEVTLSELPKMKDGRTSLEGAKYSVSYKLPSETMRFLLTMMFATERRFPVIARF
jgi:hypothetical protein